MLTINDYKKLGFRNCFHKTEESLTRKYKRYFCKDRVDYRVILYTSNIEPLTTINIKIILNDKNKKKLEETNIKHVSILELRNIFLKNYGLNLDNLPLYYPLTNAAK